MASRERELLKSQKNEIFRKIQESGLDPANFSWDKIASRAIPYLYPRLRYVDGGYYFFFDEDEKRPYALEFSPGNSTLSDSEYSHHWSDVVSTVVSWLAFLKREVGEVDLWGSIGQGKAFIQAAANPSENTRFTETERKHIASQLREIKEYLFKLSDITQQNRTIVEQRFKYLTEASERMGRKDWVNAAIGILTGIVVQLVLDAEVTRELFRYTGSLFQALLGGPPLLAQ